MVGCNPITTSTHARTRRSQRTFSAVQLTSNSLHAALPCAALRCAALSPRAQARNSGGFNPDLDEELEDAAGNVYSRKVYEDLQRQGLL